MHIIFILLTNYIRNFKGAPSLKIKIAVEAKYSECQHQFNIKLKS